MVLLSPWAKINTNERAHTKKKKNTHTQKKQSLFISGGVLICAPLCIPLRGNIPVGGNICYK